MSMTEGIGQRPKQEQQPQEQAQQQPGENQQQQQQRPTQQHPEEPRQRRGELKKGAAFAAVGGAAGFFLLGGVLAPVCAASLCAYVATRSRNARQIGDATIEGCVSFASKLPDRHDVQAMLPKASDVQAAAEARAPSREQILEKTVKVKAVLTGRILAASNHLLARIAAEPEKTPSTEEVVKATIEELQEKLQESDALVDTLETEYKELVRANKKEDAKRIRDIMKRKQAASEHYFSLVQQMDDLLVQNQQAGVLASTTDALKAGQSRLKATAPSVAATEDLKDGIDELLDTGMYIRERLAESVGPQSDEGMEEVALAAVAQMAEEEALGVLSGASTAVPVPAAAAAQMLPS